MRNLIEMPVSHESRFAFLHLPKTAGISVTRALQRGGSALDFDGHRTALERFSERPDCGELVRELVLMFPLNSLARFSDIHLPARVMRKLLPRWDTYFRFTFVRNPFELVVSAYHYLRAQYETGQLSAEPDVSAIVRDGSFDAFARAYPMFVSDMTSFFSDAHGRSLVDFGGRCETLDEDFASICERIGVSAILERENTTEHGQYREYYTPATRAIIERHFERDLRAFDYAF